jgi:uncharacterized protein YndB with AHSA1/START domain
MKATLYVLLGLGGLVALIALIGAAMPKEHRAVRTATYAASPPTVFAAISDVAKYPEWRSDVTRVELLPSANGRVMFREHGRHGPLMFRIEETVPSSRLVTRIADPSLPFGGTWTYELTPTAAGGTELTITENGEVYNPIFRFLSKVVFSQTKTMERYQDALNTALREATRH